MALITNSNVANTEFSAPAATDFRMYNTGAVDIRLSGAKATGSVYATLGIIPAASVLDVRNLTTTAVYKWQGPTGATAEADQ